MQSTIVYLNASTKRLKALSGRALLALLLLGLDVRAAELVVNGGFESALSSGWTDNASGSQFATIIHSGSYSYHTGPTGTEKYLSQVLATTAGQSYTFSFWLFNEGAAPNNFDATWNGSTVTTLANVAAFGWTHYSYTVTASSSSTTITFGFRQDPAYFDLDDVSVTPISTELVVNGGFESALSSGWTDNASGSQFATIIHSGSYSYRTGPTGTEKYLSQILATTAGQTYAFTFWLYNQTSVKPPFWERSNRKLDFVSVAAVCDACWLAARLD